MAKEKFVRRNLSDEEKAKLMERLDIIHEDRSAEQTRKRVEALFKREQRNMERWIAQHNRN